MLGVPQPVRGISQAPRLERDRVHGAGGPRQGPSWRAGEGEWDFNITEWAQAPAPAEAKFEEGR